MLNSIEMLSINEVVKASDVVSHSEKKRKFEYDLNDKAARAKLLKGAK